MRQAARVQAAIELLDGIIAAAQNGGASADRLIADYFRQRRYAGSKDRRAVRELTYRAIRACGPIPASGRAAMLRLAREDAPLLDLFDGSEHAPAPPSEAEPIARGGIAPDWLLEALAGSEIKGEEAGALLGRAPLDIRVNALKSHRTAIELPIEGEKLASQQGLRLPGGTPVQQWEAWKEGLIEVQDLGSQLAAQAAGAQPGELVVDLCAGAGGKTLALAAAMGNRGKLIACDIDRRRLSRLAPRAKRAGCSVVETLLLDPGREVEMLADFVGRADRVLLDAPCGSSGTWRRNPEARWRLDPRSLENYTKVQGRLLDIAAKLVRPLGKVIYVTCSLLDCEGRDAIDRFLERNRAFAADSAPLDLGRPRGKGFRLTPYHDDTDGFFIASLASS